MIPFAHVVYCALACTALVIVRTEQVHLDPT